MALREARAVRSDAFARGLRVGTGRKVVERVVARPRVHAAVGHVGLRRKEGHRVEEAEHVVGILADLNIGRSEAEEAVRLVRGQGVAEDPEPVDGTREVRAALQRRAAHEERRVGGQSVERSAAVGVALLATGLSVRCALVRRRALLVHAAAEAAAGVVIGPAVLAVCALEEEAFGALDRRRQIHRVARRRLRAGEVARCGAELLDRRAVAVHQQEVAGRGACRCLGRDQRDEVFAGQTVLGQVAHGVVFALRHRRALAVRHVERARVGAVQRWVCAVRAGLGPRHPIGVRSVGEVRHSDAAAVTQAAGPRRGSAADVEAVDVDAHPLGGDGENEVEPRVSDLVVGAGRIVHVHVENRAPAVVVQHVDAQQVALDRAVGVARASELNLDVGVVRIPAAAERVLVVRDQRLPPGGHRAGRQRCPDRQREAAVVREPAPRLRHVDLSVVVVSVERQAELVVEVRVAVQRSAALLLPAVPEAADVLVVRSAHAHEARRAVVVPACAYLALVGADALPLALALGALAVVAVVLPPAAAVVVVESAVIAPDCAFLSAGAIRHFPLGPGHDVAVAALLVHAVAPAPAANLVRVALARAVARGVVDLAFVGSDVGAARVARDRADDAELVRALLLKHRAQLTEDADVAHDVVPGGRRGQVVVADVHLGVVRAVLLATLGHLSQEPGAIPAAFCHVVRGIVLAVGVARAVGAVAVVAEARVAVLQAEVFVVGTVDGAGLDGRVVAQLRKVPVQVARVHRGVVRLTAHLLGRHASGEDVLQLVVLAEHVFVGDRAPVDGDLGDRAGVLLGGEPAFFGTGAAEERVAALGAEGLHDAAAGGAVGLANPRLVLVEDLPADAVAPRGDGDPDSDIGAAGADFEAHVLVLRAQAAGAVRIHGREAVVVRPAVGERGVCAVASSLAVVLADLDAAAADVGAGARGHGRHRAHFVRRPLLSLARGL